MHPPEPVMDVAHIGHLELLAPKPKESLRFLVDVLGMTESGRRGDSVYFQGWDDYERYSRAPARTAAARTRALSPHSGPAWRQA